MKRLKVNFILLALFLSLIVLHVDEATAKRGDITMKCSTLGVQARKRTAGMVVQNHTAREIEVHAWILFYDRMGTLIKEEKDTCPLKGGADWVFAVGIPRNAVYVVFIIAYLGCPELITEQEEIYLNLRFSIV